MWSSACNAPAVHVCSLSISRPRSLWFGPFFSYKEKSCATLSATWYLCFLQSKLAATLIRRLVNNSQQNKTEVFNNASIFFSPRSGLSFFYHGNTVCHLRGNLRWWVPCPAVRVHTPERRAGYSSTSQTVWSGNTKGGSITVQLTSCLTGLESAVWQLTIFVFIYKTD